MSFLRHNPPATSSDSKYGWKNRIDRVREEVAQIEKLSQQRVQSSSDFLASAVLESRRELKDEVDAELRLNVSSFHFHMVDLAEKKKQNEEVIEKMKRQHGIHAKGIHLGDTDKNKVEKAATAIASVFRQKKCREKIHEKRQQWLQANGLIAVDKKELTEIDPVKRLVSMPHVSSLVALLGEALEPLLGWLLKSSMAEDRSGLHWERFWVKFLWEGLQNQQDNGGEDADVAGPCLVLSKAVMGKPILTIPLQGCKIQKVEADLHSEHSAEQPYQFLVSQPSGRQHWFAGCDQDTRQAWISGLEVALYPDRNSIKELLNTLVAAQTEQKK